MSENNRSRLGVLTSVEKPARYIGGEWNEVRKDLDKVKVKVALAFPDVYEIAMSYLGQKILYSLLNADPKTAAERVFTPWPDYEKVLRETGRPLCSLENGLPLRDFDIVGFSLLYELNYSNVLTILDLGRVPMLSRDRDLSHPLIIAGGPAAFNPEPTADIFDLFLIGDGEEAFPEIINVYAEARRTARDRASLLRAFVGIQGVYVPSLYDVREQECSTLVYPEPKEASVPAVINKRAVTDYGKAFFPEDIVVPNLRVVFDRVAVEAARGCPQNCRFCQASSLYFPCREKDPDKLFETLIRSVRKTGYESASLSALSVGDYSCLEWMIKSFMDRMAGEKVSLSLSSLRPRMLSREIVAALLKVRKTGFTLVPEAGTERLRAVINKNLTEADIDDALHYAFEGGWRLIKYYFMIGLPTETAEDLQGIISLVERSLETGKKVLGRQPNLNISMASFIPKPHTSFQWLAMDDEAVLREKQAYVKGELRRFRAVEVKEHDLDTSVLEAVFSRGDRRLGRVLMNAWTKGARFDGWAGSLNVGAWRGAFRDEGVNTADYLGGIDRRAVLPWGHVNCGITKDHFLAELDKALKGERSASCREKECSTCLGCDPKLRALKDRRAGTRTDEAPAGAAGLEPVAPIGRPTPELTRYRTFYSKADKASLVSHVDLILILQRGFRRAGIVVKNTEGFHPKPDLSYGPALPLGMESLGEVLEFKSAYLIEEKDFLEAVNKALPPGISFSGLERLPAGTPSLHASMIGLAYSLDALEAAAARSPETVQAAGGEALDAARLSEMFSEHLAGKPEAAGISVAVRDGRIRFCFPPDVKKGFRPQDIASAVLGTENVVFLFRRDGILMREPGRPAV